MQERLIQIVQILQLRRHNHAYVQFSIPLSNSEAKHALKSAGFAWTSIEKEDEFAVSIKKNTDYGKVLLQAYLDEAPFLNQYAR